MQSYQTIEKEAADEFIEQRSRFIGYVKPVVTEQQALDFINEKRQKHWDATHNVYAYILRDGQLKRYSDDGEPHGTAGVPTLDVMVKSGVTDAVVVVTRYFGGILLGAGGLVRAYTKGAKIALEAGGIVTMESCSVCSLTCDYAQYGKLSGMIPSFGRRQALRFSEAVSRRHLRQRQHRYTLDKILSKKKLNENFRIITENAEIKKVFCFFLRISY